MADDEDLLPTLQSDRGPVETIGVRQVGRGGEPIGDTGKRLYHLLIDASGTGAPVGPIAGGAYIWRVEGDFAGATVALKYLGLTGLTWYDVIQTDNMTAVAMTDDGSIEVSIAEGTTLIAVVTGGSPSGLHSVIGGI